MNNYKIDLNDQKSINFMQIALLEKISSLNSEYWELHGAQTPAVDFDRIAVQREEYRVLNAQLGVAYETAKHKAWNALSDGSAYDKAQAAVRRAQIELEKVKVNDAQESLNTWTEQLTESRRAARAERNS